MKGKKSTTLQNDYMYPSYDWVATFSMFCRLEFLFKELLYTKQMERLPSGINISPTMKYRVQFLRVVIFGLLMGFFSTLPNTDFIQNMYKCTKTPPRQLGTAYTGWTILCYGPVANQHSMEKIH